MTKNILCTKCKLNAIDKDLKEPQAKTLPSSVTTAVWLSPADTITTGPPSISTCWYSRYSTKEVKLSFIMFANYVWKGESSRSARHANGLQTTTLLRNWRPVAVSTMTNSFKRVQQNDDHGYISLNKLVTGWQLTANRISSAPWSRHSWWQLCDVRFFLLVAMVCGSLHHHGQKGPLQHMMAADYVFVELGSRKEKVSVDRLFMKNFLWLRMYELFVKLVRLWNEHSSLYKKEYNGTHKYKELYLDMAVLLQVFQTIH